MLTESQLDCFFCFGGNRSNITAASVTSLTKRQTFGEKFPVKPVGSHEKNCIFKNTISEMSIADTRKNVFHE